MSTILAIPILSLLTILQSAVVTKIPLLQGFPDLVLLVLIAWALQERVRTAWFWSLFGGICIGFVSIIPLFVPVISYLLITAIALMIRQKIWENPILAMFIVTFTGSLLSQLIQMGVLYIGGTPTPWIDSLKLILLPSLLLNLALAAPIYAVVKDFAEWLHPEEIKI